MKKVMFVCHGNICRSPMAEFIFRHLVDSEGRAHEFMISSSATSTEELGSPVHSGTRLKLLEEGIPMQAHFATKLNKSDYEQYDYFLGMDTRNIKNMHILFGKDPDEKVYRLLDFSSEPRDIADPWYTGDFDLTYLDIVEGCNAFLSYLSEPVLK